MNEKLSSNSVLMGYASGAGAGNHGCADGPVYLAEQRLVENIKLLYEAKGELDKENTPLEKIAELCSRLAALTQQCITDKKFFSVIGGDHSSGIGTWSGVAHALRKTGDIGLIWIDAHLDSHTPETTPSGNIHGMPVAVLLGQGDSQLTHLSDKDPKIKPENLCIIGPRSYESGEWGLIKKLNVKVFYMPEVIERGFEAVFKDAVERVSKNTVGYGISLDLDALDPADVPGVGSPEKNGLGIEIVCKVLHQHWIKKTHPFYGLEIAEFNPHLDSDNKTEKLILKLLKMHELI
jgi:arginase